MADKVFLALEAERGQVTPVLVVDPDHSRIAVDQQHALAGIGEQVEHRARRQFQDALRIARKHPRGVGWAGNRGVHDRDVTPVMSVWRQIAGP